MTKKLIHDSQSKHYAAYKRADKRVDEQEDTLAIFHDKKVCQRQERLTKRCHKLLRAYLDDIMELANEGRISYVTGAPNTDYENLIYYTRITACAKRFMHRPTIAFKVERHA